MPLKAKKKKNESSWNLIRRFQKRLKRSGILVEARKNAYKKRNKSEKLKKRSALRRERKKEEYKRKKKLGKF